MFFYCRNMNTGVRNWAYFELKNFILQFLKHIISQSYLFTTFATLFKTKENNANTS